MKQPVLTTSRLRMRPYDRADWPAVHRYAADDETAQYQAWGPNTENETQEFVMRCVEASGDPDDLGYFFAITLRETNQLIGGCNLSYTDKAHGQAMMGYTIAKPYWRQGYTTEAGHALLQFGFDTLHLHRIVSHCDVQNVGSWGVMEKLSMRREAHEGESVCFKGHWHDWLRYALLAREWNVPASD